MTTSYPKIESFADGVAIVNYGPQYELKEVIYSDDQDPLSEDFIPYISGFTPEEKVIEQNPYNVFIGSNPKQKLVDSIARVGNISIVTDTNFSDNMIYDWDNNEEFVRYTESHGMTYKMTRLALHNKWIINEVARLINLDFTMTMSRDVMKTPFPKIMYPKKQADLDLFFSTMPTVIVKPFYGLQDDSRVFDRKTYSSQAEFEQDIISHYGTIEDFFIAQNPEDFVWSESVKAETPIMLQEWFETTEDTKTVRLYTHDFKITYVDQVDDEAVKTAIENFIMRSGSLKESTLMTLKCIKDSSGFAYIIDVSLAINNFLGLPDEQFDEVIKSVISNRSPS